VHGANRLASNSLLEGLVFGRRVAGEISRILAGDEQAESASAWPAADSLFAGGGRSTQNLSVDASPVSAPVADARIQGALQRVMWEHVSLYRDEAGLQQAAQAVQRLIEESQIAGEYPIASGIVEGARAGLTPFAGYETSNMLLLAQLIITAARQRHESRGGHYRNDYPNTDPALAGRHTLLLNAAPNRAMLVSGQKEAIYHV
jgi:L-aspartate oxidase